MAGLVASLACGVVAAADPAPTKQAPSNPSPSKQPASQQPAAKAAAATPTRVTTIEGLTEYRWPNGLRAILGPDPARPSLAVNLVYQVGSRHEGAGEAGMAHLLEHMLFKGTRATPEPKAEFSRRGMRWNGTTSYDRTNYFAQFAAGQANLDWMIGWLADTMTNVKVTADLLDPERTVVRSEMEQAENRPQRVLYQQLMGTAYRFHPYGRSVIGTESDLANVQPERLQAFYRRYYRPDNAVLVVSGQFDEAALLATISRTLGRIARPAQPVAQPYTLDRAQEGEREIVVRRVGGVPLLGLAYHMPPGASRDAVALSLLATMLGRQPDGLLYSALVKTGLAVGAYAYPVMLRDPGVLQIGATLAREQDRDKVLATIAELLGGELPLTQAMLERTRQDLDNDLSRTLEAGDSLALALTEAIAVGDWRLFFAQRDWVRQMTLDDIRQAAARYLVRDNRTVAWYLPTDKPQRAPAPARVDPAELLAGQVWPQARARVADFRLTPASIDAKLVQGRLEPGVRFALLPRQTSGRRVHLNLRLQWGDLASLSGRWREADLLDRMLPAGTRTLPLQAFEDRLRALDARLDLSGSETGVDVNLQVARENLDEALGLAVAAIREPVFPADVFEERRRALISSIRAGIDQPDARISDAIRRAGFPYPPEDPRHYRDPRTLIADLEAQTPERLAAFYREFAGASQGQLSAVGDFDPQALQARVRTLLADWTSPKPYARIERRFQPLAGERKVIALADKANAVYSAIQTIELGEDDPDYPALALAVRMLGGDSGSRIPRRLREREGMSYGSYSSLSADRRVRNGAISIRAIHAPANLGRLERALKEELERALTAGFEPTEIDNVRQAWLQRRSQALTDEAGLGGLLASNLYWDRDMAHWLRFEAALRSVSADDAARALRKYLDPQRLFVVAAGDYRD